MVSADSHRLVDRLRARSLLVPAVVAALLFGGGFAAGQGAREAQSAERHALERQAAPLPGGVGLVRAGQVLAADPAGVQLVDVRTREAFDLSHAAGAISLPESDVVRLAVTLPTDRTLVLYCTCPDEKTSLRTARTLAGLFGMTNVVVLHGGLDAYAAAGGRVATAGDTAAVAAQGCGCASNAEAFKLWAISRAEAAPPAGAAGAPVDG
jgi:rhodanese-related sulfurtransferase